MRTDGGLAENQVTILDSIQTIPQGVLVILSILFALSYIALAWWGWSARGFFDDPARLGLLVAFVLLAALTPACGCNLSRGRIEQPGNDWIFLPLVAAGLIMGWAAPHEDRIHVWTIEPAAIRYVGLSVFLLGCVLRIGSILALGERFSVWVAIQDGHRLMTTGLYRWMRHPSYAGAILTLLGWAMVFRSMLGLALVLTMIPPLISRMAAEERLLLQEFGREYVRYHRRTARLIPGVY